MKDNWLTISPTVPGLTMARQTGGGEGLEDRKEPPTPEGSGSCGSCMDSGPWKWIAVKTGGGVAKRQTRKVRNRRTSRFSSCPGDEHRGDS